MTGPQENRYSMCLTVQGVVNANNAVWAAVPAFVTGFADFEAGIANINTTRLEQEKDLRGIAADKLAKENEMVNQTMGLVGPLVAFANVTHNDVLKQEIDYSESELRLSRDTILENKCQIVQDRANTNSAALIASYGVTAGQITAHATSITDYHATITGPRSAIALRKTQTAVLEQLLKTTILILTGQLDQLVVLFHTTNPQFESDYTNARIIVDLGTGPNTFTGTVAAGQTKNIVNNANDDAQVYELGNTGAGDLAFGRGANSGDLGTPVIVQAGLTVIKTALELGASGNRFLNVQNGNATDGSYKVVKE